VDLILGAILARRKGELVADAEAIAHELRTQAERMHLQIQELQKQTHEVDKGLVQLKTLLRVQSFIGLALIGFLGWVGATLFTLNGTISHLDATEKANVPIITTQIQGLQQDIRELRKSIDTIPAPKPR